jgi:hypothetical protein
MNLQLTRILAVVVTVLAVLGLFTSGHLFAITSTDAWMDIARLGLAALLIYAGFFSKEESMLRMALTVTGLSYLAIGLLALVSSKAGGLLPAGLTGFDAFFHLTTGALATWAGMHHSDSSRHIAAHS